MSTIDHPRFVMQIDRQQPVPKLISINQFSSSSYNQLSKKDRQSRTRIKDKSPARTNKTFCNNFYDSREDQSLEQENESQFYKNNRAQFSEIHDNFSSKVDHSSLQQSQLPFQPSSYYTTLRKQLPVTQARNYRIEVIQLQKLLQIERDQKLQLQQIIKQLTVKSEKLQQVNEHIVQRLKEIQKNFVQQKIIQQRQLQERIRKSVNQVYLDVQNYVRSQIQQLTHKLKGERMTPLLEKKLELLMESMRKINQNTVEIFKMAKHKNTYQSNILQQFLSNPIHQKENLSNSKLHFSRLSGHQEPYKNKSSNKRDSSSPNYDRRLINNAYITSYKKKASPSRVLFGTSNKNQKYLDEHSTILKNIENNQDSNHYEVGQSPEEFTQGHISFLDHFIAQNQQMKQISRRRDKMSESYVERKKYYETSNYDDKNFHVKEYTPNKRKKIFDGTQNSKSKSKYRNSRNQ